jgi:hypothetical protein
VSLTAPPVADYFIVDDLQIIAVPLSHYGHAAKTVVFNHKSTSTALPLSEIPLAGGDKGEKIAER